MKVLNFLNSSIDTLDNIIFGYNDSNEKILFQDKISVLQNLSIKGNISNENDEIPTVKYENNGENL